MKNKYWLILALIFYGCMENENPQIIVDQSIEKHGFQTFVSSKVSFDFRERTYTVWQNGDDKYYSRQFEDDSLGQVRDVLLNSVNFSRYVNDTLISVSDEWAGRYGSSINSVLYFFQLPFGLNDPAVNKKHLGKVFLNDQIYNKVKVTFGQEGGGEDHQDEFIYWFHENEKTMDFMAYSYLTDGGGIRFRQAINRRTIGGMIFQDYINFKPENKNVDIEELDEKFKSGKLIELSRIINENIVVN